MSLENQKTQSRNQKWIRDSCYSDVYFDYAILSVLAFQLFSDV